MSKNGGQNLAVTAYELIRDQQHRFQGEPALAQDEKVLEAGTQELEHQRVVSAAAYAKVVHSRHTLWIMLNIECIQKCLNILFIQRLFQ
jgi:hypothetical protein